MTDRSSVFYVAGYTTLAGVLVFFFKMEDDILTALAVDSADSTLQLNNCTTQIFSLKLRYFFHVTESVEKLMVYENINENPMASLEQH